MPEAFSSVSSNISGSGVLNLIPLIGFGDTAPLNSAIFYVFTAELQVVSFNDDLIWNQISADSTQFRAGRFLSFDRIRSKDEGFVGRTFNRLDRLTYLRYNQSDFVNGAIGTGATEVTIDLSFDGHSQATEFRYELFDGVIGRVFVSGIRRYFYNSENLYRFVPVRGTVL